MSEDTVPVTPQYRVPTGLPTSPLVSVFDPENSRRRRAWEVLPNPGLGPEPGWDGEGRLHIYLDSP